MGRDNYRREKLSKPRNAFAVAAFQRSGGGVHKTKRPQHEPTVEEALEEMAQEAEESEKEFSALMDEMKKDSDEQIMQSVHEEKNENLIGPESINYWDEENY